MQLSVTDTATILGVDENAVYRWIQQGDIPFYKIGDDYRFNRAEILEWATAKRIHVSPDIFKEDDPGAAELPSLTQALKTGGIVYGLGGNDPASALRSIVKIIKLPKEVDRDFLYQVLVARESQGSTGVGNGIAIPHVRNPVVLHIAKPTVTLCFLEKPIDFKAIDSKPVSVFFTIVSPTVRSHLHLLSRIAFVLRDQVLKDALLAQAPRERLMELFAKAESEIPVSG
jgi:PTS system nitrogen regulatory IIA component